MLSGFVHEIKSEQNPRMNKTIAGTDEQNGCRKMYIGFVHNYICAWVVSGGFASAFTPMLSKGVYALAIFSKGLLKFSKKKPAYCHIMHDGCWYSSSAFTLA